MSRLLPFALLSLLAAPGLTTRADDGSGYKRLTIKSEVLGEQRVALVRTPRGYDTNSQRYPVLYITDGDAQIGHTATTVEFLARVDRLPEMIVVGITHPDRTLDLTPTKAAEDPKGKTPVTGGGGDRFLKFIETELIPTVEKNYRTAPFRIHAGHSLGGLFAVHSFVTKPDLFNAYIAASPVLWWDGEFEIKKLDEFLKGRRELDRTLLLSIGEEPPGPMRADFDKAKELLGRQQLKGFVWDTLVMEDENHPSIVLRAYYSGLRKVFEDWPTNQETIAKGAAAIEEHYQKLSDKYKFTAVPSEGLMNFVGYRMLGEGKSDEAIAAFRRNAERYPNSANAYDSLAEAYEKAGKFDLARTNYGRAVEVGTKNKDANLPNYRANFERASKAPGGPAKTAE
jgi:predicted alpha/beta superfamily hydrolase